MFASILNRASTLASRHALAFGAGLSCVKTGGSDYVTQRFVEGKSPDQVDRKRNLVFLTWGLLYLGGVQYWLYSRVFAKHLFPSAAAFVSKPLRAKLADTAGQKVVAQQVFLDQMIHHPFFFFPAFYQVKELIEGGRPELGWAKYKKNFFEDVTTLWSIWVPAQIFNMAFCPIWARIPFVALVSSGYTCIISYMRGSAEVHETEHEIAAAP
eukprot:CAMPEP_0206553902 /NCGR_PEP_ID=MMETSP0325_2-20121206/16882_1 /ASSEMBLY_ACC=CAM_ASM_000347 /TAXON_ID=2866 /ORGANISM="Crypthecodinium cohnii, Strain Seligo" /LENGTH=210 /DNA_ID=CAMNT_0054053915 /DNA_START=325 /DNA_END=954 /DNA_ORIENTATION=+